MATEAAGAKGEAAPILPWNGVVERTISAPLEKVWMVASDFLRFPNLLTIEPVEGENGVAGCTRKVSNLPGRTDTHSQQWAKQKLVEINAKEHIFSYEFLENNTGVDPGYYSTFQVQLFPTHCSLNLTKFLFAKWVNRNWKVSLQAWYSCIMWACISRHSRKKVEKLWCGGRSGSALPKLALTDLCPSFWAVPISMWKNWRSWLPPEVESN